MLMRKSSLEYCRWRIENHLDAGFLHCTYEAIHPCILKLAVFWFPQTPSVFALLYPDHLTVEAGSLYILS